jgi:uncharacterized repeat protein (TIGR01451 family)
VQVRLLTNGTFSNVATVNCTENTTAVTSNKTNVTVEPKVNLTVIKVSDVVAEVHVGDLINFTITVINNGLSNATNIQISDILDNAFEYVDSNGRNSGQNVTWTIGRISNGTSASVWVQVRLLTNGTFSNVATANCTENTTAVTSNVTNVTVKPTVRLIVNKTVDKTNVTIGDTVIYTVTVKNAGLSNATGIEVKENLKGSADITDSDPSKGTFANGVWNIESLAVNETATLILKVRVMAAETVENTVIAKANENGTNVSYTCDNVTVNRMDTPIRLTVQNITYGEDEIITVELPVGATGKVNITVGGTPYNDLEITPAGVVVLVVQGLSSKEYNVTASYGGDGRYASNSTNATFKVSRVVPTIKIEVEDIWYGEVEVLNVTVNAPGFVNITVNNKTITASLDKSVQTWNVLMAFNPLTYDGKATWNIENLPVGHYPVHAVYLGDENYESVSANASFNVRMLPSSVTVKAEDIFVGEPATIQVSVTPGATGNVTIDVYGRIYNAVISNGKAEIKVPGLKAGDHTVKVRYNGDDVYLPSENATTFKVKKIVPPINVDSKDIYVGDDEKITVTLPDDVTGKVTITVDGKKYTSDVINGKAVFKVPGLKAGKYTVEASYSGDDKYLPVVGSDTFKVSKVKPDIDVDAPGITVGDNGDITVILPDDATGTVTIEVAGKRYTAPVKNGIARFIVPGLKVGVHDIKVWYSGDDKYLPAETTGDIDVSPVEDGPIYHAPQGLEKHATGNPILILVVVLMSMIGLGIRKFRK